MSPNVGHEFVSQCLLSLRCLSELLQTEFHHVRTLRIMEGVYRRGMQEEVMLEAGVVHTIFPCLDQLMEWHSNFLSELLSRRKEGLLEDSDTNFTVRRIGDLLLRQVPDPATFPAPPPPLHRSYQYTTAAGELWIHVHHRWVCMCLCVVFRTVSWGHEETVLRVLQSTS